MKSHASLLAAKVAAVNRANTEAKRLYPLLVAAFAPFYGEKVVKADGSLTQKAREALPVLPTYSTTGNRVNAWVRNSHGYSLICEVRVSENCEDRLGYWTSQSHEVLIYFCDLDGQNAKAPSGGGDWVLTARTDYAEADVIALREAHNKAKKAASDAASALHPFGEYDR